LRGVKFDNLEKKSMKKKETLWELLGRLDQEAGEFNMYLSEANRYFDTAAKKTRDVLDRQEKDLHTTITKVRRALKQFTRKYKDEKKDNRKDKKKS
jgi:hypothetical protein